MKALVIGSGEFYCPFDTADRMVIACDGGLDHCKKHGIVPDRILGDFDSVSPETLEYFKDHEKKVYPTKKDMTDLELGLRLAIELGAKDITITGALSGDRFDHSLCNIGLLRLCLEKDVTARIINATNTIMLAAPKKKITVENEGRFVSLLPFTEEVRGITLEGFEYPLENYDLRQGSSLCVSNVISGKTGTIIFESGVLAVISARDKKDV